MIGILGGTFDPIHFGHLRPALEIRERLNLQELRLLPCRLPPHRAVPAADARHRLAMLELAVAGVPGFRVDRRELERPGPSYTVDTLFDLRAEIGPNRPLLLIMGMDAFAGLHTWHRWREIPGLAHVVVAHRPGSAAPGAAGYLSVAEAVVDPDALRVHAGGRVLFQPVTQLEISATAIRESLRAGLSPRFLLPDAVHSYIDRYHLYRTDTEETTLTDAQESRHAE